MVDRLGRFFAATLPGAAVIASFTLWRFYYYGSLLPNTAYAKAGGLEVAERWGLPYMLDAAQGNWFVIAWLLALGGALVDRDFGARSLAVLAIVPLWCAYVVYVGGDYMPFHRLVLPLLPTLYVLGVTGFARIFGAVPASSFGLPRASRVISVVLLAAALAFPLIVEYPEQLEAEKARQEEMQRDTERRRALGEWFAEHEPNALVAKNAVGAFGYYSNVRIVDMLGLNDEHIAHRGTKEPEYLPGHQAGDGPYVLSREQDYIDVTSTEPEFRFVSDRELANSAEFREEYHPVTVKLDGGRQNSMFKRNEAEYSPAGLNSEDQCQ